MFVGILLLDFARDFRVEFRKLAPSRVFRNHLARSQETIGSQLGGLLQF